jgi:predicted RNA-binding protein with PIN domain
MLRSSRRAVLLVDGYNIIGIWPSLKQTRDREGLEASREELIEALVNYGAYEGLDARIVFDSQYRDARCDRQIVTQNLSVYYTDFNQTADSCIERTCAVLKREVHTRSQRLIVATSDRALQLTAVGYGAEWMSAHQLSRAVEATTSKRRRKYQPRKQPSSRFLISGLDAESQRRLSQLRMGL